MQNHISLIVSDKKLETICIILQKFNNSSDIAKWIKLQQTFHQKCDSQKSVPHKKKQKKQQQSSDESEESEDSEKNDKPEEHAPLSKKQKKDATVSHDV